jgi:hypothetical protein
MPFQVDQELDSLTLLILVELVVLEISEAFFLEL